MDYQKILDRIYQEVQPLFGKGKVANYIPALSRISPGKFGMAVRLVSGEEFFIGDAAENFSIQSISKLFTLTMALQAGTDNLWKRVGREPSGNPFNSLVQLEYEKGIPRNPFINAGALVIDDVIYSNLKNPKADVLQFVREMSTNSAITYDAEVAESERTHGYLNAALANFLKSFGNLHNDVTDILDLYFHQCSIAMNCLDLARACLFLANGGISPFFDKFVLNKRQTKKVNSILLTCGTYDAVGDFAYRVGMPGKSGVGGGIIALIPRLLSVCVWSPELDDVGNSVLGTKALELFTTKTGISIF